VKVIRPASRTGSEVQAEVVRAKKRRASRSVSEHRLITRRSSRIPLRSSARELCEHQLSEMLKSPMQAGLLSSSLGSPRAVQFLPTADIIHDDLHPGNVLVSQTDPRGRHPTRARRKTRIESGSIRASGSGMGSDHRPKSSSASRVRSRSPDPAALGTGQRRSLALQVGVGVEYADGRASPT